MNAWMAEGGGWCCERAQLIVHSGMSTLPVHAIEVTCIFNVSPPSILPLSTHFTCFLMRGSPPPCSALAFSSFKRSRNSFLSVTMLGVAFFAPVAVAADEDRSAAALLGGCRVSG